jgi:peptide/nickel transport system substrate-binding protein
MGRNRRLALFASALAVALAMAGGALAQAAGDKLRNLILYAQTQAADPQAWQAAQLIAQEWRKLGLDVEVRGLARQALTEQVWFKRQAWDVAMWRFIGRPDRTDPDDFIFNLFHSSTRERGFNFVGYASAEYDRVVEAQRRETDPAKRQALVRQAQAIVAADQPYAFLVFPKRSEAFSKTAFDPASITALPGVGIRNLWSFTEARPLGTDRTMRVGGGETMTAIHPLFISGAVDTWVIELLYDRLMTIGKDGLPAPWAAERVVPIDATTIEATLRPGMRWHDGQPVTVEDVIFSFEAVARGNKVPMYRPFVTDIAAIARIDERSVRFTLKQPNAAFFTATLARINLIPRHVWEPIFRDLETKPETIETARVDQPIGSGPFRFVRWQRGAEVLLDAVPGHFAAPKIDRWILREVPNPEAALAMMRNGELNLLPEYKGDPEVLQTAARQAGTIDVVASLSLGFEFVAFNQRRPPFDEPALRKALSSVISREMMVNAAWSGFAERAAGTVSPVLSFWYDAGARNPSATTAEALKMLTDAGFVLVGGKLHYPPGRKESLGN